MSESQHEKQRRENPDAHFESKADLEKIKTRAPEDDHYSKEMRDLDFDEPDLSRLRSGRSTD